MLRLWKGDLNGMTEFLSEVQAAEGRIDNQRKNEHGKPRIINHNQ